MTEERIAIDEHVRTEVVQFIRGLRRRGVDVSSNAGIDGVRAIETVGLTDRDRVRTALRATLVTDAGDVDTFDHLFETFWSRLTPDADGEEDGGDRSDGVASPVGAEAPSEHRGTGNGGTTGQAATESFRGTGEAGEAEGDAVEAAVYSPVGSAEAVGGNPFPVVHDLEEAFTTLSRALSGLRGRRYRPGGDRPDPRRVLRRSIGTGGTPLAIPTRERERSAISALVLVDVSRSVLDTIDRGFLLEFLRRAVTDWRDVRVFFFDEDIREVTDAIDSDSATDARQALDAAETSWGGGTRIGGSLARLHEEAPDAADRRTLTFVLSDGLEMGDVDELERELSWLSRRTRRVFWLNPLAAAETYEPTARGMAAARPYVDGIFAFASPADVGELAAQLLREGPGGRIGYQFDARTATDAPNTSIPAHET